MAPLVADADAKRPIDLKSSDQAQETNSGSDVSNDAAESQRDGHYGSTDEHIFADPATAEYWRLKYEKAGYENRHRFDPDFTWSAAEEKKLVRKVRRKPQMQTNTGLTLTP